MFRVILSAFSCDPSKGSEPGLGWNWAIGLASRGFEVHCFTRNIGKTEIEKQITPENLYFHYITLPLGLERLYRFSTAGMYAYYILWQWFAWRKARILKRNLKIDIAHHVSWGSAQMGSFMHKLGVPFIFGPAGGGQEAPLAFKKYFKEHWAAEEKRAKVTRLMLRYNPACSPMFMKAQTVIVSNPDTFKMLDSFGVKNIKVSLDAALPDSFFPQHPIIKSPQKGKLNLLWTGRFLPRKGVLLLLDVMKELKEYKDIVLTVVGDGEMKESFLDKIKEYQLQDTVLWKGKVPFEEIKKYYRDYDVFFFTSLRDSCPPQCIEAMAYGMPVITLNLHGQGFIINDQTGIRCSADNPEIAIGELKAAILKLSQNPELVKQMSEAATEFALKQKWEEKINTIVEQYYPTV
ncbi:glycosyltransferase family 4 protein [Mucilaginibacter gotjawali]|uniref:Glycosyltransferase involved in cell wall biosynthesis n=1 Tax=Mucilaginibacter gotjawali TaxID=1550579 RepID=A0A839SAH2_9SPHI|nr:glycosyltransferase family 4 protein [Mucilaginibacter gotjawali]MBB3054362.1 glycosyltransferase involved in cell wall biosynthesis [Mucilaginibacter gotjawali]